MTSNTQRTLKWLRDKGMVVANVECWIPRANKRRDAFGIIDLLALDVDNNRLIGIQSTGQAFAAHKRKILDSEHALPWLLAGNELWLIGWRKVKLKRGGKAMRWKPRIHEFTVEDFIHATLDDA